MTKTTGETTEREAYLEKLKARLDEWNARIAVLEARANQSKAEVKRRYAEQVAALKRQRDEVRVRVDKLRKTSGDAWRDVRRGIEEAGERLGDALERAREHLKD
ncbi:MAG: sll1863 family stress response protein [Planctomycetota bacterium]|jgi:septal ring factor EnvC (AmiA/AmiB activator)